MVAVIKDMFRNIKSNLLLDCILLLQFASCFFASTYLISYYFSIEDMADYYETVMGKNLYWIFPEESIIEGGKEKIAEARSCIDELRSSKNFQYMLLSSGQLVMADADEFQKHMTEEERANFQFETSERGSFHDVENNVKWTPMLNTFNMDWSGYQYLNKKLLSGREFMEEDFTRDSLTETTPIMMGSNYADYFQEGDRIKLIWADEVRECEVIGFLDDTSNALLSTQTYLNSYILYPSQDRTYSLTENVSLFIELYHYSKCLYAWILTEPDYPPNRLTQELNDIMGKYSLGNLGGEPETFGTSAFKGEMTETVHLIAALVIFWLAFLVFSVLIILFHKIDLREREYAILLMNGIPYRDILLGYLLELAVFLIGAVVTAFIWHPALRSNLGQQGFSFYYLVILAGTVACILLLAAVVLQIRLKRMKIEQIMERKE